MTDDLHVVRSIRVATALHERVGILMRGPTQFQEGESFANMLGELRQIYPEVWSHLDDARKQLAARGQDVAAYDALRAMPMTNAGGVLQVDVADGGGSEKSAHLNHQGHALATQAIHVLRAAMPGVDWVGLDRAEEAELAAFGSLGPPMWKKVVFGLIAFGVLATVAVVYLYLRITGGE